VLDNITARRGELLCRPKRTERRCQDWSRLPVVGISWDDAAAFAAWAGGRLCTEREWERAARGADGRLFPGGDVLEPGDANFEETYGRDGERMGADEVGSFPADRSPFGVFDLAGNAGEWVTGSLGSAPFSRTQRGSGWDYDRFSARTAFRGRDFAKTVRTRTIGLRVCGAAPTR
jgi:formylglycine-generating enzyme required for sulfatase activity